MKKVFWGGATRQVWRGAVVSSANACVECARVNYPEHALCTSPHAMRRWRGRARGPQSEARLALPSSAPPLCPRTYTWRTRVNFKMHASCMGHPLARPVRVQYTSRPVKRLWLDEAWTAHPRSPFFVNCIFNSRPGCELNSRLTKKGDQRWVVRASSTQRLLTVRAVY